jgi:hypothetical protein
MLSALEEIYLVKIKPHVNPAATRPAISRDASLSDIYGVKPEVNIAS